MTIQIFTQAAVMLIALAAAIIDLRIQKLPKRLTDPMLATAALGAFAETLQTESARPFIAAVLGAAALSALPAVYLMAGAGGFADIPFAAALGGVIGWHGPAAIATAVVVAAIFTWTSHLCPDDQ